jgi:hypothetical protein
VAELRIVVSDEPPFVKVFVGEERIALIQRIRFAASAQGDPQDYGLEIEFPSEWVLTHLPANQCVMHQRQRDMLEPFMRPRPAPPRLPGPTAWEHITRDAVPDES